MGIRPIELKIRFITPLLLHGSEPRSKADHLGLGKALRGCWRFWFRAIIGGMVDNISKDSLLTLENTVFGSADKDIGPKFRMRVEVDPAPKAETQVYMGFKYKKGSRRGDDADSPGFEQGLSARVILCPREEDSQEFNTILPATVWLWANLGGIGQRARRGFGSVVMELFDNSDAFTKLGLEIVQTFNNMEALETHLSGNLPLVWKIFDKWLKEMGCSPNGDISENDPPTDAPFFILRSLKQIAVAKKPFTDFKQAIEKVHGSDACDALGYAHADTNKRQASPVFTRFHAVNGRYGALAVLCNQQGISNHCSAEQKHEDCIKSYLKKALRKK